MAARAGHERYLAREISRILQCVMGWEDTHVHRFVIRGACYSGVPEQDQPGSPKTKDERAYMLRDVAPHAGQQFAYDYDFGDYWQHILVVERTISREEGVLYPLCLAGARACPPEVKEASVATSIFSKRLPTLPIPSTMTSQNGSGGNFDPEAFDLNEVNRKLHKPK